MAAGPSHAGQLVSAAEDGPRQYASIALGLSGTTCKGELEQY